MKKSVFISFIILVSCAFIFAQQQKAVIPTQFTKEELLAFNDVKALLNAINKEGDYTKYIVRNFNLATILVNVDGIQTKLSEMSTGGTWSDKQKNMIEQYAMKGALFTLENITMVETGKKGMVNQPTVFFSIKG